MTEEKKIEHQNKNISEYDRIQVHEAQVEDLVWGKPAGPCVRTAESQLPLAVIPVTHAAQASPICRDRHFPSESVACHGVVRPSLGRCALGLGHKHMKGAWRSSPPLSFTMPLPGGPRLCKQDSAQPRRREAPGGAAVGGRLCVVAGGGVGG